MTQTSLLRVFDPMEMYSVIENLQQTIQELQGQSSPHALEDRQDSSALSLDSPTLTPLKAGPGDLPSSTHQDAATLQELLAHVVSTLDALIAEPNPSSQTMKTRLIHLLNHIKEA